MDMVEVCVRIGINENARKGDNNVCVRESEIMAGAMRDARAADLSNLIHDDKDGIVDDT